jgi:hypothetical protein
VWILPSVDGTSAPVVAPVNRIVLPAVRFRVNGAQKQNMTSEMEVEFPNLLPENLRDATELSFKTRFVFRPSFS